MASAKKNKEINHINLVEVKHITDNQKVVFDTYKKDKNKMSTQDFSFILQVGLFLLTVLFIIVHR